MPENDDGEVPSGAIDDCDRPDEWRDVCDDPYGDEAHG
jgi:hypothetical protein